MGSIGRKIMLVVLSTVLWACAFDGRIDSYEERLNSWSVIYYDIQEKYSLSNIQIYLNIENNPYFKSLIEEYNPNTDNRLVQSASKIFYNEEEILVLDNSNLPTYSESSSFYFITKPKAPIHEIGYENIEPILNKITMSEFDSIYNLKKDTYKTLDASIIKDSFKRVLGWELR